VVAAELAAAPRRRSGARIFLTTRRRHAPDPEGAAAMTAFLESAQPDHADDRHAAACSFCRGC
jgi:hypothetical protein